MIACLGKLEFNINNTIESLSENVSSNIDFKKRIGKAAIAIKKAYPTKLLEIEGHILKSKSKEFFTSLEKISKTASKQKFILGNGQVLGYFCLESYEKSIQSLLANGSYLIAEFSLSLRQISQIQNAKSKKNIKAYNKKSISKSIIESKKLSNIQKLEALDPKSSKIVKTFCSKYKWSHKKINKEAGYALQFLKTKNLIQG